MEGCIFDIKRFAIHDGCGIRTTIFLKGCGLRCVWCQNPEGLQLQRQVLYLPNKCIRCGSCASIAQAGGIVKDGATLHFNRHALEDWDHLIDVCPSVALLWDSKIYGVEEVINEVKKDDAFFRYGGGVSISGGEPFFQHAYLLALLKALKAEGIHTTIETSLYVETSILKEVLPYVDVIYADLKIFDNTLHKRYTGVDNTVIKDNFKYLLQSMMRDKLIVRTPLIPGMSATDENLSAIATFLSSLYNNVTYELLNYNPLAKAKYALIEKEYCFEDNPILYTAGEMDHFYKVVQQAGLHRLVKNK